jgi:hypothetical protein
MLEAEEWLWKYHIDSLWVCKHQGIPELPNITHFVPNKWNFNKSCDVIIEDQKEAEETQTT